MVPIPRFFRKTTLDPADIDIDIHAADVPPATMPSLRHTATTPLSTPVDPVRKSLLARVAVVSIEENADLPALLHDDTVPPGLVQRIMLPRNPRIAGDELYELDGMDMIIVVSEEERRISKDTLRWLKLLKQLGVPMFVLLPYASSRQRRHEKIEQFSQYVGLPIVTVTSDKLDEARQDLLVTTMRIAPATGLALAAHMPHFRSPLMATLLETAIQDSLQLNAGDDIASIKTHLVRQICAAYGYNGHQLESEKIALQTLVDMTTHYTARFVARLPIRDLQRRARLTNTLSTFFVGHATMVHLGATPPSFRKVVLPQIWRLYRASGKPVLE